MNNENSVTTGETVKKPAATLRHSPLGWIVDLQDASGNHILSSAAYDSKFLAEEALAKIIARDAPK